MTGISSAFDVVSELGPLAERPHILALVLHEFAEAVVPRRYLCLQLACSLPLGFSGRLHGLLICEMIQLLRYVTLNLMRVVHGLPHVHQSEEHEIRSVYEIES